MDQEFQFLSFQSPVGLIWIAEKQGRLTDLRIGGLAQPEQTSPLLQESVRQLSAYFSGKLNHFDLPLAPKGTAFQLEAWQGLREIPFGSTRSYLQQAQSIGRPQAQRAVGGANRRNPIPIIIPCHRVINHDGGIGGYAFGLEMKRFLLHLEGLDL